MRVAKGGAAARGTSTTCLRHSGVGAFTGNLAGVNQRMSGSGGALVGDAATKVEMKVKTAFH